MRALCILTLVTALLSGCGSSPPTRFYSLDAVKPERVPATEGTIPPLEVNAVRVPPLLDRRAIVRRETGNQLDISSRDRWGASFGEMARDVLTEDLQNRLPPGAVIPPNTPAPANTRGLVVDILSFVPDGTGQVALTCDWTLLEGAPAHPVLLRTTHLTQPTADNPSNQAEAMSELLGKLADQIAAVASTKSVAGAPQR